jgi:hypothetical protein
MTTYHKIDAPFLRDNKGKLQQGLWCRPEFEYLANNAWEFTEKVDGTNIRIYADWDEKFGLIIYRLAGRTEGAQIPNFLMEGLQKVTNSINDRLTEVMTERDIKSLVIYGEGIGPKINNGARYTDESEPYNFVAFDVKVGNFWLLRNDVTEFCDNVGLDSVPVYGVGSLYDGFNLVMLGAVQTKFGTEIDHAISPEGRNGLKSHWGPFEAEGIVAVPTIPLFNRAGNRIITKIKSKDFR